jgi:hypothetical protein
MLTSEFQALWIAPMTPAIYNVSVKVDIFKIIPELREANNILRFKFIVEDYPLPPVPIVNSSNNDLILNWIPSPTENREYYLIYRAEDQLGFDFANPYYNTSLNLVPLANEWVDDDAGDDAQELYYCIRTVNVHGWVGYSSITVGKYTKIFNSGYDFLSLPLAPFSILTAHEFLEQLSKLAGSSSYEILDSTTVYNFNQSLQQWQGHPKFLPADVDNFELEVGKGYMVYTPEPIQYTFTGYPGSMINYIEILWTSQQFRESLEIHITEDYNIELKWDNISFAHEYKIYSSQSRTGFNYSNLFNITENNFFNFNLLQHFEHNESLDFEYYFTIVPIDILGRFGSSTYSIGVRGQGLGVGYHTFSVGLKPEMILSAHSLLDEFYSYDIDTIYRYDSLRQSWWGHPRFLPGEVDDFELGLSEAYISYIYLDKVKLVFIGR